MNPKVYLLVSLVLPVVALVYILIGIAIDSYTGHFVLAEEIADGGLFFLFFSYLLLTLISFIATFIIVFFVPLVLKSRRIYNRRNFMLAGSLVGAIIALIVLELMAEGNLSRENGLYSFWFGLGGLIFGFITVYLYSKYAYALDLCD